MIRLHRLFSLGMVVVVCLSTTHIANAQRSRWNSPAENAMQQQTQQQAQEQSSGGSSIFGSWFGGGESAPQSASQPGAARNATASGEFNAASGALHPELAKARLLERRGDSNQAIMLFKRFLESEENLKNPIPYHRLGVIYASQGNFEEAHRYFGQSFRLNPRNVQLLSDIGYSYYLEHKLKDAEVALRRADSYAPNNESVCINLGLTLGMQGRFEEAMQSFKKVCTAAQSYANLAYIYSQMNRFGDARSAYLKALTLDKDLKVAAEAMLQVDDMEKQHKNILAQQASTGSAAVQQQPAEQQAASTPMSTNAQAMARRSNDLLNVAEVQSPSTANRTQAYGHQQTRQPMTIASRPAEPVVADRPTLAPPVGTPSLNAPNMASTATRPATQPTPASDGLTAYQRAMLADQAEAAGANQAPTLAPPQEDTAPRSVAAAPSSDTGTAADRDLPAAFDVTPRPLITSSPIFAASQPTVQNTISEPTMPGKLPDVDEAPVPVANDALFQPPRRPPVTISASADPLQRPAASSAASDVAPRRPTQVIVSDIDEPVYSAPYRQTPQQATDPRFHRSYYR